MNDTYVEVMVARKKPPMLGFLKILLYALAIICFLISMYANVLFLAGAAIFAALAFFMLPRLDIEYEYLYLDKEITIDKIMSKEKRKNVYTVDLNKMEFMARASSHELDSYKARNLRKYDFTSRQDLSPVYTIVYTPGGDPELIDIEPNEEMLHAIKTVFPRKVIDV